MTDWYWVFASSLFDSISHALFTLVVSPAIDRNAYEGTKSGDATHIAVDNRGVCWYV